MHIDNKNKDILILGQGLAQGLDSTTLTAEAKYPINFPLSGKRFVLSLYCNGSKYFEVKDYTAFLGNISKDFTVNDMEKKWD